MMRHALAAAVLAVFAAFLIVFLGGCGPTMSPTDAYRIEMAQCAGNVEAIHQCRAVIERKYSGYLGEGNYPPVPRSGW
jgi:ABC-type uncharacterized transport system auxiliary subunit